MPQVPRPDQQRILPPPMAAGSRSGAQDLAGALGYPGISPAVPNCQSVSVDQQNVINSTFFTFPAASRLWMVLLSYVITSNASFFLATARVLAKVHTSNNVALASVNLGVAGPSQVDSDIAMPPIAGLPVTAGTSLILNINGGTTIPDLDQQASVIVLYSTP